MTARVFLFSTHVKQRYVLAFQRRQIFVIKLLYLTFQHVFRDKADHINRVFRRSVRRCVSKVEISKLCHFHSCLHSRSDHVDTFVNAVETDSLRADNFPVRVRKQYFYGHHFPARIIGSVRCGRDDDLIVIYPRRLSRLFVYPDESRRHVKHFEHGRGMRAFIRMIDSRYIVGGYAPLFICGSRKRYHRLAARYGIGYRDRVSYRIYIGIRGLHSVVYDYASLYPDLKSRFFRERGFRSYADSKNSHIRFNLLSVL